jgi:hypothetical protein
VTSDSLDRPPAGRRFLPAIATVVFVTIVCGVALSHQQPPAALPAEAPPDAFSAMRAMTHVAAIAREPHPLGTPAAEPVRAYLLAELKALGFEPEIQQPHDARPKGGPEPKSFRSRRDVRNIIARWRGTGPDRKKALLLSAHYDSRTSGPGAGDDASGVAAILESLRALKAGPPPDRDVIALLTDGEEAGLLGASVFSEEHTWAKDVGVALNFDARGNSGPSYMFEASAGNGWLIEQLAQALPHPMATSLTGAVYRIMPNDTDFTIYNNHSMPGLNFAFIGGLYYYHSPEDTPANLDPRALQHQGENLLAMARHLVRLDLDDVRRDDVVYLSVLQQFVAIYPMSWVIPLLGIAALAYLVVIALGLARRRVRLAEIVVGFGVFLLSLVAAMIAADLLWFVVRDILLNLGVPVVRLDYPLLPIFSIVAVLAAGAVFVRAGRRRSWEGLGLGILGWWLAATAATSLWLPGASYAFLWPLLAILAGQAVAFLVPRGGTVAVLASWLSAVPLLIIHTMILPGLFVGLNLQMTALLMVPVVLIAGALVPMAGQVVDGRVPAV